MKLKNRQIIFILILFILTACNKPSSTKLILNRQFIAARDEGQSMERPFIYQAFVPINWVRKDPLGSESISDTTKSNCEFYIHDNGETIRITIHTFPILENHRIPPQAQISRWKKQFDEMDALESHVNTESHGGFIGLVLEGKGQYQGKETKMMGWSMQLASKYEQQLNQGKQPLDHFKRADYTIKAIGSPELMDRHRSDLIQFAQSFELIDELPSPL